MRGEKERGDERLTEMRGGGQRGDKKYREKRYRT